MRNAVVRKAASIEGKSLVLRNVVEADAQFILSLRSDERKSRHLSRVQPDIGAQESWIRCYAERAEEAYFLIEDLQGTRLGTVRLYDGQGESFCWGSWIITDGAPASAAIESALIVYAYAVDTLGFSAAHFQVHKSNEKVCRFHERFGAELAGEDENQFFYTLSAEAIANSMRRYRKYLPDGISITELRK